MRFHEFALLESFSIGSYRVGDVLIDIRRHAIDQLHNRKVPTSTASELLRKIPMVADQIRSYGAGAKVWVYDPSLGISIGMRPLDSGKIQWATVVIGEPYGGMHNAAQPIVVMPLDEDGLGGPSKAPIGGYPRAPNAAELDRITQQLRMSRDPVKELETIVKQIEDEKQKTDLLQIQLQKLKTDFEQGRANAYSPPPGTVNIKQDPRNPSNWVGNTPAGNPAGGGPISKPLKEAGLSFMGYPCTQDCSGHQAGYDYAKFWGITDPNLCPYGNSNSFWEGCKAGASGQ